MKSIILLLSLLPFISSCHHGAQDAASTPQKFDKVKWQTKQGEAYPYRDAMLKDLIDSVTLKGIKYDSVIILLGQPERNTNGYMYYRVSRREIGGFTLGTKTFVIKLTADSTVEWRKIHGG